MDFFICDWPLPHIWGAITVLILHLHLCCTTTSSSSTWWLGKGHTLRFISQYAGNPACTLHLHSNLTQFKNLTHDQPVVYGWVMQVNNRLDKILAPQNGTQSFLGFDLLFISHLTLINFPLKGKLFNGHLWTLTFVSSILATYGNTFLKTHRNLI